MKRVFLQFSFRQGWFCEFLEEDRKTRLPRTVMLTDERKLFELVKRGGFTLNISGRQELKKQSGRNAEASGWSLRRTNTQSLGKPHLQMLARSEDWLVVSVPPPHLAWAAWTSTVDLEFRWAEPHRLHLSDLRRQFPNQVLLFDQSALCAGGIGFGFDVHELIARPLGRRLIRSTRERFFGMIASPFPHNVLRLLIIA